jgi:hypothetical protein
LPERRFPPPWTVDEIDARRRAAAGLLTRDEVRRIAVNIAMLPDLLRRPRY